MPFTPLTEDQFNKAKAAGFSTDDIINFEKKRKAESGPMFSSEEEGRQATAEAEARQRQLEFNAGDIGKVGMAAKAIADPAGRMANSALFGLPGITSELLSGGKMVNPLTHGMRVTEGGTNVFEGKDLSPGQKLAADVGGMLLPTGALLKATGLEKQIGNVMKYRNPKNVAKLADETDKSLMLARQKVVDNYGPEYEKIIGNSDKKISLAQPLKNISEEAPGLLKDPAFAEQLLAKEPKNAQRIMNIVKDFGKEGVQANEISAQEADKLQKFIKNLPGIKTKLAKGYKSGFHNVDFTNEERILLDFANDIKSEIIDSHQELGILNKDYGSFMNDFKAIRSKFGVGKTENLMKSYDDLGKNVSRFTDTVEKVLPKSNVEKIKDYSKSQKTGETLKKLGWAGLGLFGLGKVEQYIH